MSLAVKDIHWLAGFFDGEAAFTFNVNACRIVVGQKDAWPLLKVQQLVGGNLYRNKGSGFKPNELYYSLHIVGRRAVGLMMTVYTLLSPRRQRKIVQCIARWRVLLKRGKCNMKTHCKRGHELNDSTTFLRADGLGRECRVCSAMHKQSWYQNNKLVMKKVTHAESS